MTSSVPSWLESFPESTRQLFADSSQIQFVSPNLGSSRPVEGEFRFLFSRKMNQEENSVPRLVLIRDDMGDDLFQVALTHCEQSLATYSDIFLGREETRLDYSIFVATAIVNTADISQLGPCLGKLTSNAQSLLNAAFNRRPITDDWRRGRRFSSNSFVAMLDPRWRFVTEEVRDLQSLCESALSYMDLLSAFTKDQLNSLLQGGLDEIECEDQFAILNAKFQKLQLA
jgi:hypothetical protein